MTVEISERRLKPRVEAKIKVKIAGLEEEIETYAGNLSKSGVFLETLTPFADVGEKVQLELSFPKAEDAIKISGKIVRVTTPNVGSPQGIAIEFVRVDTRQARAFEKFLDQLLERRGIGSRKNPRAKSRVIVELTSKSMVREVISENVSTGGMFLKTSVEGFLLGDQLNVVIVHPASKRKFPIRAEVVHLRRGESSIRRDFVEGIGIRFTDANPRRQEDLLSFLKSVLAFQRKG